jgi:D-alanyl-D-alanine carboxypeptidase/D-alanyl-D-alanine-endopeptidase (penicillin-binding protein 4)
MPLILFALICGATLLPAGRTAALAQTPPPPPPRTITQPGRVTPKNRPTPPLSTRDLASRISAIIDTGEISHAYWGIDIRDARTGASLFQRNANQLMEPASNLKLVVSATASQNLPPDFRYHTGIYAAGRVAGGTLNGDLIIRGRGDPTISGRYEKTRTSIFDAWADSLKAHGVNRITGRIVADQTYFDEEYIRSDWETYDLNWWYAAPVAPIGFNDNSIDFRVAAGVTRGAPAQITWEPKTSDFVFINRTTTVGAGARYTLDFDRIPGTDTVYAYGEIPSGAAVRNESFATRNPGKYAGTVLRETLQSNGISVGSDAIQVVDQPNPSPSTNATLLFEHVSHPLPDIIGPILQNSQNWFAEQLAKTVAREVSGDGSWSAALNLERRFLIDIVHIDSTSFRLRDASGLSTGNLITPHLLSELVRYIGNEPRMKPAYDAMSVSAAPTGSLRRRFEDLPGRVRAKTGSISNVDSLTGMIDTDSGRHLVFSIIVNNSGQSSARMRDVIDRIVRLAAKT